MLPHTMPVVVRPRPIWQLKTSAVSSVSASAVSRSSATSWSKSPSSGAVSSVIGTRT